MNNKKIISSLKPVSKYLLEFIDTNLSHKVNCFQKTRFSPEIMNFFHLLFEKMIFANQEFKKSNVTKITNSSLQLKGHDYHLIDEEVRHHIENMTSTIEQYSFVINSRTIQVSIICEKGCDDFFFKKAIKQIYIWLFIALSYSNSQCSQTLSIFLYLTELEKTTPTNSIIDRINVNTGFTFSCKTVNEINIYRKEEWFKVLIHESFHNLGLDFSHHECSHIDKIILSIFPVNADVRLYETYCELWAEIINVMFIVFYSSNDSESLENMIKKTEKLIDYERTFSLFQCAKVLKYMGISYNQLHERNDQSFMVRKLRYKEKTSVLSYYVLKSILFYKINNFLEWCILHNGYSIKFGEKDINEKMNKYCDLIREHYLDKRYIDCLRNFEEWLIKQEKTNRREDIELKTLRMSLFEI